MGETSGVAGGLDGVAAGTTPMTGPALARGVCRALAQRGWASLTEVTLANGRRADVMALAANGALAIVEVKCSVEDFRADQKWPDYRGFCDLFYFAVPGRFPMALVPEACGLIVADAFTAEIVRPSPEIRLEAARRKAATVRFAQHAARRLQRLVDPLFAG